MKKSSAQPPVFVISLEGSGKRKQPLLRQLERQGIGFKLFEAVDASKLTAPQLANYHLSAAEYFAHNGKPAVMQPRGALLRGEIGCALSHIRIYEEIVKQEYPWTLILEDDVELLEDDMETLFASINLLESKWHILFLDYLYFGTPSLLDRQGEPWGLKSYIRKKQVHGYSRSEESLNENYFLTSSWTHRYHAPLKLWGREVIVNDYMLAQPVYKIMGSHAYAISYAGAVSLLSEAFPVRLPADVLMTETENSWIRTRNITPRPIRLNPELQLSVSINREKKQPREGDRKASSVISFYNQWVRQLIKALIDLLMQCLLRPGGFSMTQIDKMTRSANSPRGSSDAF